MITGQEFLGRNVQKHIIFRNLISNDGDDESETMTTGPLACV